MDMEEMNFEDELLYWIACDAEARSNAKEPPAVPVQLLMTRMSVKDRGKGHDLTQSTVLSLRAFDRATLLRTLKQLESKDLIRSVDREGNERVGKTSGAFSSVISDWLGPDYVTITDLGIERAEILIRKHSL